MTRDGDHNLPQHASHPRSWWDNRYVYPVISRRSHGLSIGINISVDQVCTFDCVYCQVDRTVPPDTSGVNLTVLREELATLIDSASSGRLYEDPLFSDVPRELRRINDLAFSGDGEPTASPTFRQAVELTAGQKRAARLDQTKIVLITNASCLTDPDVVAALDVLDANQGEIWAKLDAGTEAYFQQVNRASCTLDQIVANITETARHRPIVIQSMFLKLHDRPATPAELDAYIKRLTEIQAGGGQIDHVQVYTVAREPVESYVSALSRAEVDAIVDLVQTQAGLAARPYYGRT